MISVAVGTFGDERWAELARKALQSVERQTVSPASVHHVHAESLHEARNKAAAEASSEWLCFLDADDELDARYLEHMQAKIRGLPDGEWLLQPSMVDVVDGVEGQPYLIPRRNILTGNYLVIGTLVRKSLFEQVGGFYDWPLYEDWDLWIRCIRRGGAVSVEVPSATYRVTMREGSRNNPDRRTQIKVAQQIRSRYA